MSNLITKLRADKDNVYETNWYLKRPADQFNTLFFPGNLDVRLAAKNGCSTLKHFYHVVRARRADIEISNIGVSGRKLAYYNVGLPKKLKAWEQFRPNSHRICIKRDPIERALSAVTYLCRRYKVEPTEEEILNALLTFKIDDNTHFFTQHYYMRTPDLYDTVYELQNMPDIWNLIKSHCDFDIQQESLLRMRVNISNNNIKASDLPERVRTRIIQMYEIDYDNGWGN